jgi:molybdopterin/thiamine biosynthesis adenylyltransferase
MSTEERYVLIGLGGIGGIVARMLVPFLHHRGEPAQVHLVDGDSFEESNRGRQLFHRLGPKAVVLAEDLSRNYDDRITLVPVPDYVTAQRARFIVSEGDVVFCTPDNHATRRIVERRCARLANITLFSGGNDGIEGGSTGTYGNVQIYARKDGTDATNRLSAFHPEIANPVDKLPTELGCGDQVHSAPQLLFTNLAVASGLLGAFYAWHRGSLTYEEAYLDILTGRAVPVTRALVA